MSVENTSPIVNLLEIDEFTEEHLEIVENLMDWKKIWPELFGDGLPKEIKFVGFRLLPHSAVVYDQRYRAGGKTKKNKKLEIQQNIERNGYKLKYPAAAWFHWGGDDYHVITGNSRGEITKGSPFNIPNMIVAVYEASDPSYTKEQIEDALDSAGLRFNAIHDPAAPVSKEDVKRTVELQIKRWHDTKGAAGCAPTVEAITGRVDYVCGEGVFQPNTRQQLILSIYNTYNPHDVVISWSQAKSAAWVISEFMTQKAKWVNTDKIIYMPCSYDTISQAFRKAFALGAKNPNKEIRIVIHTGTLDGYDFERTYQQRVEKFVDIFTDMVNNTIGRYSNMSLEDTNVKIYGVLPALKSSHSITEPFFFNSKTGTFFQKESGCEFSLPIEEDMEEFLSAA